MSGFTCFSRWADKLSLLCKRSDNLLVFESEAEVEKKAKLEQKILIMYKDHVYDVTTYLDKHPGGKEILLIANAKIVDKAFDKYHYPKGDAPNILKRYLIGKIDRTRQIVSTSSNRNLAQNEQNIEDEKARSSSKQKVMSSNLKNGGQGKYDRLAESNNSSVAKIEDL